ncbi:FAD-dependent oxidoreductase [Reyranella sp.]|uniref:FAD-dependent oxidoreductase n=1 Tax=Reyranella sp. TaxID=1929291 RepID=UPI00271D73DD|nr:FAD-dependent oxidoreductase [Reyranella sp.]MDO8972913.1 FAD-dependent oxidoreductase [Reyranella sp.]
MSSYTYRHYPYTRPAELDGQRTRRPVVIVGAGMAGPTLALALARRGVPSVTLDEDDTVSLGSRSICQAKHSLEIWDRFGVANRMAEKGITWEQGEVYLHDKPVFRFNLQPEPGHKFPAFVNLQQYYVEEYLYERCLADSLIEMRFRNKVLAVTPGPDGVAVEVETPDGRYTLEADWLVACDGVRSTVRHLMDLPYPGEVFHDRFLISDIRLLSELPKERRFWFYPPFHPTNSVLLHRQADNVLRVDFQLGSDADPEEEKKPENIDRRLRQMFGPEARWEHEWTSVYTFTCRMMERFVHGRVIFAGDAAHVVSPFGARGGNGAIADVDNLAWKLAMVLAKTAPVSLLDSYCSERRAAAQENILNSTRSTDFITPKFHASRVFRDATLSLARDFPFARALINSGRLSVPTVQPDSPLDTPDGDADWLRGPGPGRAMLDAPVGRDGSGWLIDRLGPGFTLLTFGETDVPVGDLPSGVTGVRIAGDGLARQRYDGRPGTTYLIRPDRYVAARWRRFDAAAIAAAIRRATGNG